jgi:hypothetical protein
VLKSKNTKKQIKLDKKKKTWYKVPNSIFMREVCVCVCVCVCVFMSTWHYIYVFNKLKHHSYMSCIVCLRIFLSPGEFSRLERKELERRNK